MKKTDTEEVGLAWVSTLGRPGGQLKVQWEEGKGAQNRAQDWAGVGERMLKTWHLSGLSLWSTIAASENIRP